PAYEIIDRSSGRVSYFPCESRPHCSSSISSVKFCLSTGPSTFPLRPPCTGNSQSISIPSNKFGQRRMKSSIADSENRRLDESVSAASENLADPPHPPIDMASLR